MSFTSPNIVMQHFLKTVAPAVAIFLCAACNAASAERNQSMNDHLISPAKALLSPHGARLEVVQSVEIKDENGQKTLEFLLPQDGSNLQLDIPGQTIARWSSIPVIYSNSSILASKREELQKEKEQLTATLETVKARIKVWQAQTGAASSQDLEKRQSLMQQEMPMLSMRQEQLQQKIDLLNRELNSIPETNLAGQKIRVTLSESSKAGGNIQIRYTYDVDRCGWQAVYDFNASTDNKNDQLINVRMLAEVWQYTGMDWKGTEITLASRGNGSREPEPLPRWIIGAPKPEAKPQPRMLSMKKNLAGAADNIAMMAVEDGIVEANAPVSPNTDSIYATWTLSAKGLPEGKSRVAIATDTWKTSLQWLARPTMQDNRVFLMAKYDLPANQAWPAGIAQFSVDGQNVGNGTFMPKGRETTFYFGPDPRVNVRTTINTNRLGETGFINTSKTWTGSWTYTISNEHDRAIKVRVERPAPMIANEQISVTYKDQPPSKLDEKEHLIYWDVDVPEHGKTVMEHGIIISSPEKLPLFPPVQ